MLELAAKLKGETPAVTTKLDRKPATTFSRHKSVCVLPTIYKCFCIEETMHEDNRHNLKVIAWALGIMAVAWLVMSAATSNQPKFVPWNGSIESYTEREYVEMNYGVSESNR
jgi:hypothetical protein